MMARETPEPLTPDHHDLAWANAAIPCIHQWDRDGCGGCAHDAALRAATPDPAEPRTYAWRPDYGPDGLPETALPERVVVGANGAYWRDYGQHYSMCPVSDDNDPVEVRAVYVRAVTDPAEPDPIETFSHPYRAPVVIDGHQYTHTSDCEWPATPDPADHDRQAVQGTHLFDESCPGCAALSDTTEGQS
jgi:hypothetical protein